MVSDTRTVQRIVLILQLVSAWFLVPELIGVSNLRLFENITIGILSGALLGAQSTRDFGRLSAIDVSALSTWGLIGVLVWFGTIILTLYIISRLILDPIAESVRRQLGKNAMVNFAPGMFLIFTFTAQIALGILPPWIDYLVDDELVRYRASLFGMILLTLTTIGQLILSFVQKSDNKKQKRSRTEKNKGKNLKRRRNN